MNKVIGIYKCHNLTNNKAYIGKSVDTKGRLGDHRSDLKRNVHRNKHLQNAYNLYGKNKFEFSLIEECNECDLSIKEQYWIDYYLEVYGEVYNTELNVINSPTIRNKHSIETKLKIIKNRKSDKLNESDVKIIVEKLKNKETPKDIAKIFNVGERLIRDIANGKRWTIITNIQSPIIYKRDPKKEMSEETKNKIRNTLKGRERPEEVKTKISNTLRGQPGRKHTEETKIKLRQFRHSEDTKRRISESKRGKIHSEETKKKISETKLRNKYITETNPNENIIHLIGEVA